MRWPWQKRKRIDPELRQRIENLEEQSKHHLDSVRRVAGESQELVERTANTKAWAERMREENHFVEAYLPPKKLRLPWKR